MRNQNRWCIEFGLGQRRVRCRGPPGHDSPTQNFRLFRGLIQCSETFLCDRPHAPALEACHAHGDPDDLPGGQRPRKPQPQNRVDTPRQTD